MPEFRPATDESPPTPPQAQPPEVPDAPARPKRRRGRTTALIFAAALLGVAGGTAVGYTVQAERKPTPLPALGQQDLAYPAKPDKAAKSAALGGKANGDLRKLLVSKPKGAKSTLLSSLWGGYLPVASYVEEYENPKHMLESLSGDGGIRRVAAADWERGYKETQIRLVQFGADSQFGAIEHARSQLTYMPFGKNGAGNDGVELKGSAEGRAFVYPVKNEPGYLPLYKARAIAYRGDVMVDIHIFDTKPIKVSEIRSLAERQVGRL